MSLIEIRAELASYVKQAEIIEEENKELKKRVEFLEREMYESLESQRQKHLREMIQAKENWEKEAVIYGREQCEKAYEDFDKEISNFYSLLSRDQEENTTSWPISEAFILRYSMSESCLAKDVARLNALSKVATHNIVHLTDFDILDSHISIHNSTKHEIPLKNYGVHFRRANQTIWLVNGDLSIPPGEFVSVWWGLNASTLRHCPSRGSFGSENMALMLSDDEVADLVYKNNKRVLFSVPANQFKGKSFESNPSLESNCDSSTANNEETDV